MKWNLYQLNFQILINLILNLEWIFFNGSTFSKYLRAFLFELLFIDSKVDKNSNGFSGHDYWDQTLVGFVVMEFPRSKLKLFILKNSEN